MNEQDLWDAQLREFPDSVRVTPGEVVMWAQANLARATSVLVTIDHPPGIYYRITHEHGEWRGYRYGVKGEEYVSFAQ